MRIGQGYDVHRFAAGRPLILGGVEIPHARGLAAHSDGDVLIHALMEQLPFGGIGASGMGHYHGYEGFLACSKLRPVFYQARFSALKYFAPPYGTLATRAFEFMAKLKG